MDRRERARVAGVDRAQEGISLGPAQFSHNDPIGPHPQRRLEQIIGRNPRFAQFTLDRQQPHRVGMAHRDFGGILDQHDPFVWRDFAHQSVEKRRLSARRPARDQHIAPRADKAGQEPGKVVLRIACRPWAWRRRLYPAADCRIGKGAIRHIVAQIALGRKMLAKRDRHVAAGRGRGHDLHPRTIGQGGRKQRMRAADTLVAERRNLSRQVPQPHRVEVRAVDAFDGPAECFDPCLAGAVDQHVGHIRAREQSGERREVDVEVLCRSVHVSAPAGCRRNQDRAQRKSRFRRLREP